MKKLITLLILFTASCIVAQDVTVTLGRGSTSYRDTLTATIDSVKINAVQTNNVFTIYAYTLTGTDTINVYTTPKGYTLWSQKSLVDLSTNSVVTQIIATTTPKEYLLQDPEMVSMLLVTPDGSAGTVFIVSPKSTANPINAATPNSLPLPTGAATAANQVIHNTKLDSIDATASRTETKVATETTLALIKNTDGIKKITDALPAGTNIIGQVGIDQTTDGTTNKVQARNATHGDFQVNANLQVGDADVDDTNPVVSKPYLPYVRSVDTWGASADTSEYDFGNNYLKGYVTVYDSSATADTLVFEVYSHAKLGWTTQMIGFRDVVTDYVEIDNATVIVAGTTAKKFEINKLRPGRIRVRPKTPGATWQTKRVVFEGVN